MHTNVNVASGNEGQTQPKPVTVLVADDDPQEHLLITMAAQLATYPLAVSFVSGGRELLERLAEVRDTENWPDVILLDLRMPDMDGWVVLREIETIDQTRSVPVLVYTGSARPEDEAKSYECGAQGFQTKPTTFVGMQQFLDKLLDFVADFDPTSETTELDDILSFVDSDVDSKQELVVESLNPIS